MTTVIADWTELDAYPKWGELFLGRFASGYRRRNHPEYQKDWDKYRENCRDVLPKYDPRVALSQSDYDKLEYHPDHRHFEPERLGQESEDAWLSRVKKGTVTSLPVVVAEAGKASGAGLGMKVTDPAGSARSPTINLIG